MTTIDQLQQAWPMPAAPKPIAIIGAGGIVSDAHLPAYRKAGFPIAGIFDIDADAARKTSEAWGGLRVLKSIEEAHDLGEVIFDLATPPDAHAQILEAIPSASGVLIQKPMGSDLEAAQAILAICRERGHIAAVNFQMRFAPMILALKDLIDRNMLGAMTEADIHINIHTPWYLFPFLKSLDRVEIAVHSIHYLDVLRYLIGEPDGVYARSIGHPSSDLRQTRTSAILSYGDHIRCALSVNHHHVFGPEFEAADVRIEGMDGVAVAQIGVLRDYPNGIDDALKVNLGDGWLDVPLAGNWFVDAFLGPMSNLQRVANGEDERLISGVKDAIQTMALVEAAYRSSASGGEPIPQIE